MGGARVLVSGVVYPKGLQVLLEETLLKGETLD